MMAPRPVVEGPSFSIRNPSHDRKVERYGTISGAASRMPAVSPMLFTTSMNFGRRSEPPWRYGRLSCGGIEVESRVSEQFAETVLSKNVVALPD
ncbi:MAG: hypothetical protein ACI89J_003187 [Hyphomicrobiaceae bacterium]|jgi:hypothetical protein